MKKFLSLVLALIMTMSLVTISAGATEYRDLTDKEEIQYEEAVAVLNRIGVITGYEDGSFRPETELTRGAAAKIIVSLMIGPDAAAALPNNSSPYPDVPASHTFAGVISYCKTAGYISGYGDGTFKPANPLTGYAFAKMLLGAIGYKSSIEGFTDTGWVQNVARIGSVAGLFDRISFDGSAAVTRDEACQLALNTLKATMVDYGSTNTVVSSSGEVLTVQGSKAQYVTSNNRDINANINRRVISATNNELTLEFGEEHFKDLRLEHDRYDPAYDNYGRPSNEWSYKKVTIGTFPLPADFTFTKQMAHREDTVASKEKALGLRGYDTYSTDHRTTSGYSTVNGVVLGADPFADATQVTINGYNARVYNKAYTNNANSGTVLNGNLYAYDAYASGIGKDNAPSLAEICDLTDNGVTVEVYVCPVDADFITNVVVVRTQLMKIKTIGSDYVALENISPDSKDPRKEGSLEKITGYNAFAIDVDTVDVKDSNYDAYNALKEMKAGDRVAVVPYTADQGRTWEAGEVYAPETASGALTKIGLYSNTNKPEGNAISLTVGGTEYPVSEWNADIIDADGYQIKATKKDVTLYLDKLGNVLWADEIGNSDAWMVVGDYYQATNSNGKVVWFVHGWTIGGDEVNVDLGTIRGEAEKYAPGELVRYTIAKSGTGEYKLSKPSFDKTPWLYKNGTPAPDETPLTAKKEDVTYKTGEGIYEISQYAKTTAGAYKQFSISSGNSDLALENYKAEDVSNKTLVPAMSKYKVPSSDGLKIEKKNVTTPTAVAHEFEYNYTTYDGVKFIFVSFDNYGEVETIDFRSGVQNVSYADLTKWNQNWTNVGTNGSADDGKFIANAAEAYVNDSGKVKAVVIKSDSPEANLSNIAVITDYVGSDAYESSVGASNGTEYTRKYRVGPKFDEELTGTFDRRYNVGDVVTIRSTSSDEIITAKYFHGDTYLNTNPDLFVAEGVTAVKSHTGSTSKSSFVVGGDYLMRTVDGTTLTEDMKTTKVPYGVNILSDDNTLGDLTDDEFFDTTNRKGLVTVDSSTVFVDQRAGHRDNEIDSLGDLIDDYKLASARLKVLVGGKPGNSNFRHAYVIVVEYAEPKTDDAETPDVSITSPTWTKVTDKDGKVVEGEYTVPADKAFVLSAVVGNSGKCGTLTYAWTIDGVDAGTGAKLAGQTLSEGDFAIYKVVVSNTDTSKKDSTFAKAEATVKVTGSATDSSGNSGSLTTKNGFVLDYDVVVNGADSYVKAKITYPDWVGETAGTQVIGRLNGFIGNMPVGTEGAITFTRTTGTEKTGEATVKIAGAVINGKDITLGESVGQELKATNYKVKYEGTDVAKYVAGQTKELAHGGAPIALTFSTTAEDATINASVKYTVTGSATEVTTPTAVTASSKAITSLTGANVVPKGDGFVVVTLTGLDKLVQAYSITTSGALDIEDVGDPDNASGTITLTGAPATAIPEGTLAAIQAEITDLDSNYAYKVTVTLEDKTELTGIVTAADTATTLGSSFAISKNIDLTKATVKVEAVPALDLVGTATASGANYIFNFNRPVATKSGFVLTTDVTTDSSTAEASDIRIEGTKVTVIMSEAVAGGKFVKIGSGALVDAEYTANATTADATYTAPTP